MRSDNFVRNCIRTMLRRCSSDPCGLAGVGQEGIPTGMLNGEQNLKTLSASSKPRFLLEHGRNLCGQEASVMKGMGLNTLCLVNSNSLYSVIDLM